MEWKGYLKASEAAELIELDIASAAASKKRRQIRQRCEKRAARAKEGTDGG